MKPASPTPGASIVQADTKTTARVVESMVLRGDISALSPEERAKFYLQMCESLGLSAASQPFAVLRLNGKEILYATRGATDQLAAIHRLNREIVDGPKVIDVAGTKMIYAQCRATHPNGRVETSVATVPATDLINALMKCESKAKRRATLSILGLGLLDEAELETIPAHARAPGHTPSRAEIEHAQRPALAVVHTSAPSAPSEPEAPAETRSPGLLTSPASQTLLDALAAVSTPEEVVRAWRDHGPALQAEGREVVGAAYDEAVDAFVAYGGEGRDAFGAAILYRTPAEWAAEIEADPDAGHIAGGYHKRAELWRARSELAAVREITVARLCVVLPAPEARAEAFLSGCHPDRERAARRASRSTTGAPHGSR